MQSHWQPCVDGIDEIERVMWADWMPLGSTLSVQLGKYTATSFDEKVLFRNSYLMFPVSFCFNAVIHTQYDTIMLNCICLLLSADPHVGSKEGGKWNTE